MRSFVLLLLLLLGLGAVGCAGRAELPEQTASAAPQPKPGTVTARMGGEYTWIGAVHSRNP